MASAPSMLMYYSPSSLSDPKPLALPRRPKAPRRLLRLHLRPCPDQPLPSQRCRIVDSEADQLVARFVLLSPVTNASWEARSEIFEEVGVAGAIESAASPESGLVPRSPSRSRASVFHEFSSNYVLGDHCRNTWNEIRMGKLVEDVDALPGTLCCYEADVGNFLCLKCCVLCMELDNPAEPLINVEVAAHVMQPELRSSKVE